MRGDELHALDERILDIHLQVGERDQSDTQGGKRDQGGHHPFLGVVVDGEFERVLVAHDAICRPDDDDGNGDQDGNHQALEYDLLHLLRWQRSITAQRLCQVETLFGQQGQIAGCATSEGEGGGDSFPCSGFRGDQVIDDQLTEAQHRHRNGSNSQHQDNQEGWEFVKWGHVAEGQQDQRHGDQ